MRRTLVLAVVVFAAMAIHGTASAQPLDPAKLEYLGAFRPPGDFVWMNGGIGFYPAGNGGVGSMISFGHDWQDNLGEYTIPDPVNFKKKADGFVYGDLTVAGVIKAPAPSNPPDEPNAGGPSAEYLADIDKVVYGSNGYGASHGYSDVGGTNPQGPWALTGIDMRRVGHYICEISPDWATANLPAGQVCTTGFNWAQYGRGPDLYAYDPDSPDGNSTLPATKLIEYSGSAPWAEWDMDDYWGGSAWVETVGSGSAVILAGRKDTTNMGNDTNAADEFHPWLLLYDPDVLAEVAAGAKTPSEPVPYQQVDLTDLYFGNGMGFDAGAYDRANNILYIQEDESTTAVIHAFQVIPEPATMGMLALGFAGLAVLRRRSSQ